MSAQKKIMLIFAVWPLIRTHDLQNVTWRQTCAYATAATRLCTKKSKSNQCDSDTISSRKLKIKWQEMART